MRAAQKRRWPAKPRRAPAHSKFAGVNPPTDLRLKQTVGMLRDRLHGRWPAVAAACALPVAGAVGRLRRTDPEAADAWLPLAVLLVHQTEEWVWPGGFLPWINEAVLGSSTAERPITRRLGFVINVGLGWGVSALAAVAADSAPWVGGANAGLMVGNIGMHSVAAACQRRYNPGLVTAVVLFCPTVAISAASWRRLPPPQRRAAIRAAGLGIAFSAATFSGLRQRARRATG